jgi:hypothetical protein
VAPGTGSWWCAGFLFSVDSCRVLGHFPLYLSRCAAVTDFRRRMISPSLKVFRPARWSRPCYSSSSGRIPPSVALPLLRCVHLLVKKKKRRTIPQRGLLWQRCCLQQSEQNLDVASAGEDDGADCCACCAKRAINEVFCYRTTFSTRYFWCRLRSRPTRCARCCLLDVAQLLETDDCLRRVRQEYSPRSHSFFFVSPGTTWPPSNHLFRRLAT